MLGGDISGGNGATPVAFRERFGFERRFLKMTSRTKRRLAIALAAYAILGATALWTLDGFLRIAVFVFLAGLAFRTIRAADEDPMD